MINQFQRTWVVTLFSFFILSIHGNVSAQEVTNQPNNGPYLGQKPPGQTPEVFAPGMVSTELYELFSAFTPDMKEFYFVRYDEDDKASMIAYAYENNTWNKTIIGPRVGEPSISPDGQTMHLGKRYMERTDSGWSEVKMMEDLYSELRIMRLTVSSKGTYFFDEANENPIRYARLIDGVREQPKELGIDLGLHNAHPFIAPDESYLIWDDQRESGYGGADLYISFRQSDGSWGPAINMGETINTAKSEIYATITPDGKYLLFNRRVDEDNNDIFWVDAGIIESLRTQYHDDKSSEFNFPTLEGPYLGQKPPGLIAEPFAPGIISTDRWEVEGTFSPDLKEFYFTTSMDEPFRPTVIGFRMNNNKWEKYIEFRRRGEVSFSPDGSRMHMAEGYKDRQGDGWSDRKSLGEMFERDDWGIMRLTASSKGTYVFDDYKSDDVIRMSTLKNGERQAPVKMGPIVNSGEWTAHPFIAPDESYLIWDSEREEGYGDSDLYISFKQEDDSWGPAINMGEAVNTDRWEAFGTVTADGKYLLFNRGMDEENDNVDIYWVDAQIIESLKPE